MKDATTTRQSPLTDDEMKAEIDGLAIETRQMLDKTRRNNTAAPDE